MNNLKDFIIDLNRLVLDGRWLEAFDKYYHEDVVMQENESVPTLGKSNNRAREVQFLDALVDFRKAEVLDVAIGDNTTMVVWYYDYTHKDWGIRNYKQVSVQKWSKGKIIHEQFFYGS